MVARIVVEDNLWARVEGRDNEIDRLTSFRPRGYVFANSYRKGHWDGVIHAMKRWTGKPSRLPTGLVPYVVQQLPGDIKVEWLPKRPAPLFAWGSSVDLHPLLPHQVEAVEAAVAATRGIIHYPTWTGKSRIIFEIVRSLGVTALVLCDKRDLWRQLTEEGQKILSEAVVDGAGHMPVLVSTYQTMASHLDPPDEPPKNSSMTRREWWAHTRQRKQETVEYLKTVDLVICDEAQHCPAATYELVLRNCPAFYRFATSATPDKSGEPGDLIRVMAWTGPIIARMSISEGVDSGRLVPAKVFMIHPDTVLWAYPDEEPINYKQEVQAFIVENKRRNNLINRLAGKLRRKGPTLIIVDRIEHGANLAYANGCDFAHGGLPKKERATMFQRFKDGETTLLVVSKIADEGIDLPSIAYLILASGGRAPHRQIQRIGRGMRAVEGKDEVLVFDFDDQGKYLARHSRRRRRTYEREAAYTVIDIKESELWLT